MRSLAGILLLVVGVVFPMAMLLWLNGRLNRKPALLPRQVTLLLALNGTLPVFLVTLGMGLLAERWSQTLAFKGVVGASALAVLVLLAGLWSAALASPSGTPPGDASQREAPLGERGKHGG